MTLIIQEDDYQDVNIHELDSNGEIEIHWDHPDLDGRWSYRHAEWAPRYRREDPRYNRSWTTLKRLTEKSSYGVWKLYRLFLKKFDLKEYVALSSEELLKLSPNHLRSLKSRVEEEHQKCPACGNTTFCRHSIGRSGNDPVDDFRLICPECGEIDQDITIDMGNDPETCPWCGMKTF